MKFLARVFAISLVATGAFASIHPAKSTQPMIVARVSTLPIAVCPPDDPNACHIGN